MSALVDGVESVCVQVFEVAAQRRAGMLGLADARHALMSASGWRAAEPLPEGHVPYTDQSSEFLQAPLPGEVSERVYAAYSLSDRPHCTLIIYGDADAAAAAVESLSAKASLTRLSIGAAANAGIDMFGRPASNPAADFGIAVYAPVSPETRAAGIGGLVDVSLIPKDAIRTGVFPPAE